MRHQVIFLFICMRSYETLLGAVGARTFNFLHMNCGYTWIGIAQQVVLQNGLWQLLPSRRHQPQPSEQPSFAVCKIHVPNNDSTAGTKKNKTVYISQL